jgi:putative ABC transport system permease protein
MALIAATAIVYEQLQFTFNKDIGFQKENLLVVNNLEWLDGRQSFVEELKNISGVIGSSLNSSMPPGLSDGDQFLPEEDQNRNVPLNYAKVDESYIPTLGIEILHGRNFSETVEREKYTVIINEAAAKSMGWEASEEVLQKRIIYPGSPEPYTIIGIAKDFNYWSLQSGIEPMALFHIDSPGLGSYGGFFAGVRVESTGTANTLAQIESLWKSKNAGVAFSFNFIDDAFAESFQSTEQFRKSLSVFAGLALFIAGLGLLGMIIYVIEQRTKEIGIRKVLGSSTIQVVLLMSRKFVLQVFIALIISIPVTYWAMSKWLLDFQYRINISPMIFILAGVIATLFAFSIVGFHSYRAAQMNPAKALKDE